MEFFKARKFLWAPFIFQTMQCAIKLQNILLGDGKSIDANQEMLALGACNILSSFVNSMPVTGALSRGAVNNASGVKTTFGGVYTGKHYLPVLLTTRPVKCVLVSNIIFHPLRVERVPNRGEPGY